MFKILIISLTNSLFNAFLLIFQSLSISAILLCIRDRESVELQVCLQIISPFEARIEYPVIEYIKSV
jgi:hypothetical protein